MHRHRIATTVALAALFAAVPDGPRAGASTSTGGICVENASRETLLLAVEAGGTRRLADLAPGGRFCVEAAGGGGGVVSAFRDADSLEGCSRLAPPGVRLRLLAYADFDRCRWASHGPAPRP